MSITLDKFPVEDLASRCVQESSKKQGRDDRYGFELLRRAFRVEDEVALEYVLNIYKDVWSVRWVRDVHIFDNQIMTIDDFKSMAFYQAYDKIRGEAFDNFPTLSHVLSYLQVTLVRCVAQYIRSSDGKNWLMQISSDDDNNGIAEILTSPGDLQHDTDKKLLWEAADKRLRKLLPDPKDHLLLDLRCKQRLKSEVIIAYALPHSDIPTPPPYWKDEEDLRVNLQRIMRRIRKDGMLRDLFRDWL